MIPESIELPIRLAKAVIVIAIAAWEITLLLRRRRAGVNDPPLRVLVAGLLCLAFSATVGIHADFLDPVQDLFGDFWRGLINAGWMAMAYCFATYFLLVDTATPTATRRRRARRELLVFAIAAPAQLLLYGLSELEFPQDYDTWQITTWYVIVDCYALAVWGLGLSRAARYLTRLTYRWARLAVWLVIAGSAGMVVGVNAVSLPRQIIRVSTPSFDPEILEAIYSLGQLAGQMILAIGLGLAPLATLVVNAQARWDTHAEARYTHKLRSLWTLLTTEMPGVILHEQDDSVATEQGKKGFDRTSGEISEGLAQLAPYCSDGTDGSSDPQAAARIIRTALENRANNHQPAISFPSPRIEPDFGANWRARARWMTQVSQQLEHQLVAATPTPGKTSTHATS